MKELDVMQLNEMRVAIIGLGYVGLPLAVEFGYIRNVIGYDVDEKRIKELEDGFDRTQETNPSDIKSADYLSYTASLEKLAECNVYIITVPTPIDEFNRPDLRPLLSASADIGTVLSIGDIVIYESTVYPGCTEEECAPVLQQNSGLKFNEDFFVGYSPERINPGDRNRRLNSIVKLTSGSTDEVANVVDQLYGEIIKAGTFKVDSIRVAEAAKVIENTQRDVNIALVNELAIIFNRLAIDTESVLEAAGTKWNFLPFRPGLVGGHCIGVDPFYLTYKAQSMGYEPKIILSGRKLNDEMGGYVASQLIKSMLSRSIDVKESRVLIMGFTFKENCPDVRNTKIIDVIRELEGYSCVVDVFDPWVDADEAFEQHEIRLVNELDEGKYDAVVVAVAHAKFKQLGLDAVRLLLKPEGLIYDLKYVFPRSDVDIRL